jgi:hypothetical protein
MCSNICLLNFLNKKVRKRLDAHEYLLSLLVRPYIQICSLLLIFYLIEESTSQAGIVCVLVLVG